MARPHPVQALPVLMLAAIAVWHFYTLHALGALGSAWQHSGAAALAFAAGLTSLFYRGTKHEATSYIEGLVEPLRPHLIGLSCFIMGGLHLLTMPAEPVFVKMAYLVLVLAYFETAGIANRFLPASSGDAPQVTRDTMRRLVLSQFGMLALTFALSVALLYMSLMTVVGFFETWTVALLAAMMILALAFMAMVRRI